MNKAQTTAPIRESLLSEIIEEIGSLDGSELDAFLLELGLDPESLLEGGKSIRQNAIQETRIARLRDAQAQLRSKKDSGGSFSTLDSDRKYEIFERIKQYSETSGEMTLAARNSQIDSEQDLDTFLDACFRLGLIDETGELIDEQ